MNLFTMAGAEVSFHDGYPGWQPIANSDVQQLVQDVYRKLFNKDAAFKVIHAGLECGTLGKKYPNWDMASFGPTIKFPRTLSCRENPNCQRWPLLAAASRCFG